jgi:alpha-tubulin suppressor-like RCC1 family protein
MATTQNLGKMRLDYRGTWSNSYSYQVNDTVLYRQQTWICTTANSNNTPVTGSSYWTIFTPGFNYTGTWAASTAYAVNDVVLYALPGVLVASPSTISGNYNLTRSVTQAFICIQAHTSSAGLTPNETGYWTPVNRRGVSGSQTSPGVETTNYNLGIYSNNDRAVLILPNRGIAFDSTPYYRGGSHKNTLDSESFGFIANNGQLMTWGNSNSGSLGQSQSTGGFLNNQNALTFAFYDFWRSSSNNGTGVHATPDNNMPRAIQWEKNLSGNLVLFNSGEVFSWGYNSDGANGDGSTTERDFPVRVGGSQSAVVNVTAGHIFANVRIKRISMSGGCGYASNTRHCLALDESGNVWAWGYNGNGQLGNGNNASQSSPVQIPRTSFAAGAFTSQSVVAIWACGTQYGYSFAVTADGNLFAWGYNNVGQLGLGSTGNSFNTPQLVTGVVFGSVSVGYVVKIQALDAEISQSYGCAAVLTSTGAIYTAGNNASGWMGNGNTTAISTWTQMGSGPGAAANQNAYDFWLYGIGSQYASCMVRNTTGAVYVCGKNNLGQLGINSTTDASTFVVARMNIGGQLYNLVNVARLGFAHNSGASSAFNITAAVTLDGGQCFSIGYNSSGQASQGTSSALGTYADPSGLETVSAYVWQPVRSPSYMQGYMADVIGGCGIASNTNNRFWMQFVNKDGRQMVTGPGRSSNESGNGASPIAQYRSNYDNSNCLSMTMIVGD